MSYALAAFIMAIVAFGLRSIATARLRGKHPAEWARLGKPALMDQGPSDYGSIAIIRFFFRGEFFHIEDRPLQLLCVAFDLAVIVGVILMVLAMWEPA